MALKSLNKQDYIDKLYNYLTEDGIKVHFSNDNDDFDVDKEIRKESDSRNIESDIFSKWN